jgi:DNA repair protein RadC
VEEFERLPSLALSLLKFQRRCVVQLEQFNNKELLSSIAGEEAAEALMQRFGNLTGLAQASFDELTEVPGIGERRAKAIKSAFLLAQRLSRETYLETPLLDTPERVADLLREENRLYTVENFQVALLNTRRRLLAVHNVSQGTLDTLLVHPREVFKPLILMNAAAWMCAHNHPSGDPTPSQEDRVLTSRLRQGAELLGIGLLDHLILTDARYYSFADQGWPGA